MIAVGVAQQCALSKQIHNALFLCKYLRLCNALCHGSLSIPDLLGACRQALHIVVQPQSSGHNSYRFKQKTPHEYVICAYLQTS